jgi:hypothetical protein
MKRYRRPVAGLLLWFLTGVSAGPLAACRAERREQAGQAGALLKLVDEISRQRPLTAGWVGRTVNKTLRKTDQASNQHFDVYESGNDPESAISSIELRAPAKASPDNGGLVILTLGRKTCIAPESIRGHFGGAPDDVRISNPDNPQRTYTLIYRMSGAEQRFAFDSRAGCLAYAVIDQIETRKE